MTRPAAHDDVVAMVQQTLLGDAWEHAALAVAVFSDDGHYLACNRAFCVLTGYERDEILRMRVGVDLAVDPAANTKLFNEIVRDSRKVGSGGLRREDGSTTTVSFWAIATRAAGMPYEIALYWEATERPKRRQVG